MNGPAEDRELARLKEEAAVLKLRLEEAIALAAIKEKVLKANLEETEGLYRALSVKFDEVREKSYEIKVLNVLNRIIATASKYVSLKAILQPTLEVMILSIEDLMAARGLKAKVTGGIFIVDEATGRLEAAALSGIQVGALGCEGCVNIGECICGLAASAGEIVFSPDCFADPRHTLRHATVEAPNHAHIAIPLKSGEKPCGVIFLYLTPPGYTLDKADAAVFTAISAYVGLNVEKARLYEATEALATHDGLTGLFNRREFQRFLSMEVKKAVRYGKQLSLLMLDIDHFKRINDAHGHPFGDEVLKTVATIAGMSARDCDITARYGGEEFAVILPETAIDKAAQVAERIRSRVEGHSFSSGAVALRVTVSVGAASLSSGAGSAEALLKAADDALYGAKEGGRNRVVVAGRR